MKIRKIEIRRLLRTPHANSVAPRRRSYIETAPHAFPLHFHAGFSRRVADIPGIIHPEFWVRIEAEDGTTGLGQGHWGDVCAPLVTNHFAPLLEGRDAFAHLFLNDLMWRYAQRFGPGGFASLARSAIDQALWDLKGKLLGQPVWRLLGGPCRTQVPLYATTDDLDWALELGFGAFKISNPVHYSEGLDGLNRLEEKVAAARETVGPDAELMLNPNMSFNVDYAIKVAERLAPYRLRWLEEPLPPADLAGHVRLKRACPTTTIATGEDHHGRLAFRDLIAAGAVDVVQPDLRWCGGLTEGVAIYALAEAAGVETVPHAGGSTPAGLHFSMAMPEVPFAEYWLPSAPGIPLDQVPPVPGFPAPENGRITASDAPGFGLEIREDDLAPWQ